MRVITAPESLKDVNRQAVFLAGSIEQGKAEEWQTKVTEALEKAGYSGDVLNPRRKAWDDSWVQSIDNPQFNEQVNWELDALEKANRIVMYFDPTTKSPISLLELGLHAKELGKLIVVCPEGFWRKGNVDIVCHRNKIKQLPNLKELVSFLSQPNNSL